MLGIGRKNTAFKVLNIKSCHILSFGLKMLDILLKRIARHVGHSPTLIVLNKLADNSLASLDKFPCFI